MYWQKQKPTPNTNYEIAEGPGKARMGADTSGGSRFKPQLNLYAAGN
jgi:hypothetical protein